MCAWKIDELCLRALSFQDSDVALDGDARVIANALFETGQAIEQCALAGIGITDNRDARVDALRYGYLIDGNTSFGGLSHQPLRVQL